MKKEKIDDALMSAPLGKSLFFFSLPILLGNVLQSVNGSFNAIMIGRFLGESAFAASSNANIIMFFLLSSIFGIGMATTILVGQSVGAKNMEQTKRIIGSSALFYLVFAIVVSLIGFLFSSKILVGMRTPPDAIEYAIIFLRITFIGVPLMFGFNFLMMILRGVGDSKTPFKFLIVSTVVNVILNPILIFGFGPIPAMGIAGSATAMVIAQFVSLFLLVYSLYRKKHFLRFTRADLPYLRFDGQIINAMLKRGLPMGFQMIVVSSSSIALINLINVFGSEATAAYGAAMQLSNYVQMPALAIGGAVSTIAAQNIGANQWDRVHRLTYVGLLYNFLLTGSLVTIIYFFNREALQLFLQADRAVEIGMRINNITLWSFIVFGMINVLSGIVRATGAVMVPLMITFMSLWIIRVPLAYVLAPKFGLDSIWWGFPLGFIVAALLSFIYYYFGKWKEVKMLQTS